MKDLAAQIRDLIARHSASPETARTNRQNAVQDPLDGICAIYARDSGGGQSPQLATDPEFHGWPEDALFTYWERLGIGADLGMDLSIGSEAERVARREARRVAAGIPADFPASRDGDLIDEVLAAFAPMQLTFLSSEPRSPEGPTA
ncbi:MAG: hypothetical protein IT435_07470 [Phycisphaerales bacterium]|nr:hypothetical protein [Phycisphaerales bacterium]